MGQGASKAAGRVGAAAGAAAAESVKKPPRHLPSLPGKNAAATAAVANNTGDAPPDPRTGFTRGQGRQSDAEEAQRQFLQSQPGRAPAEYTDRLPADLIKFMTDAGPLTNPAAPNPGDSARTRLPRSAGATEDDGISAAPPHGASRSPSADRTRRTENMRLAQNIEGHVTKRTTSFSYKADVVDVNDVGLDVVQFYSLLTGKVAPEALCPGTAPAPARAAQQEWLAQTVRYLQVPVLLQDSDESYVGAWPGKVEDLLREHHGMEVVPPQRAKLVLQDLWEIEEEAAAAAKVTSTKAHDRRDAGKLSSTS